MAKILEDYGEIRRVGPDGKFRYEYECKLDCGCYLNFDKRVVLEFSVVGYMQRAAQDHRCLASSAKLAEKALSYMGHPVRLDSPISSLVADCLTVLQVTEVPCPVQRAKRVRINFRCGYHSVLDIDFSTLLGNPISPVREEVLGAIYTHDKTCVKGMKPMHIGIDKALGSDHTTQWFLDWNNLPLPGKTYKEPSAADEQWAKQQEAMIKMAQLVEQIYPSNPLVNPVPKTNARISEGSSFDPIPIFTKAELDEIRKAWRDAEEARFKFDRFQLIELD